RAVRAEQRDDLAGGDRQVEVADDRRLVVAGGQRRDLEDVGHSSSAAVAAASSNSEPATSAAALPKYPSTTFRSRRTDAGGPCAITLQTSNTTTKSQIPNTTPMSWSPNNVAVPASTIPRNRLPNSTLSFVSRPAAGSSNNNNRGLAANARATPTSFRCPC